MKLERKSSRYLICSAIFVGLVGLAFACRVRLEESNVLAQDKADLTPCIQYFKLKEGKYVGSGLATCEGSNIGRSLESAIRDTSELGYKLQACFSNSQDNSTKICVYYKG